MNTAPITHCKANGRRDHNKFSDMVAHVLKELQIVEAKQVAKIEAEAEAVAKAKKEAEAKQKADEDAKKAGRWFG